MHATSCELEGNAEVRGAENGAGEPVLPGLWPGPRSHGAGGWGAAGQVTARGGGERLTLGGGRRDLPAARPQVAALPIACGLPPPPPLAAAAVAPGLPGL